MERHSKKIAVIAGTLVDTKMGADFVEQKNCGIVPVQFPVSTDCDAQNLFQRASEAQKKSVIARIFDKARSQGIEVFFVYCNSLSGAFDFESFVCERGFGEKVVTPLQIYEKIAKDFDIVGTLSANSLSALGIENALMKGNRDIVAVACANLAPVRAVEAQVEPDEIVKKFALRTLTECFSASGCKAVILGCTHFPYFKESL